MDSFQTHLQRYIPIDSFQTHLQRYFITCTLLKLTKSLMENLMERIDSESKLDFEAWYYYLSIAIRYTIVMR